MILDNAMSYIKSIHIEGFKKFNVLDINFNEHMNILVGHNEAGKSTILEAICIVMNQLYRNSDKSVLRDLFNVNNIETFQKNPSIDNLPRILIEITLGIDSSTKNVEIFYGEEYGSRRIQKEAYGIRFECKLDRDFEACVSAPVSEGKIPYEYYSLTWTTFANRTYNSLFRPLKLLLIDTSNKSSNSYYNYYNKTLFINKYDEETRTKVKHEFRAKLEDSLSNIGLPPIDDTRKFGIDTKKVPLESVISIYDGDIALENRGSGMDSLIKTKIALDKNNGLDTIMIEEPETHLGFSALRKMLDEIMNRQAESQIIVSTHSSMITSRLNLKNVLWISDDKVISLHDVRDDDADFFAKVDNNSFLQLLLSKKIFLVEGATEFLMLPYLYKQETGHSIEEDNISVISCNGISYMRYLRIGKTAGKRIAVLTDNDGKSTKISDADEWNNKEIDQRIFMSSLTDMNTWEVCFYHLNAAFFDDLTKKQRRKSNTQRRSSDSSTDVSQYPPTLMYMLRHKVDVAFWVIQSGEKLQLPQHVIDAVQWIQDK